MTATFVWDKNYDNTEQMRPYLADFMAIRNEIQGVAYNSLFKGRIPGLAESANEDTGIYLLQTLADLEEMRARARQFVRDGGYYLTNHLPAPDARGTLVRFGFYMGGTGWRALTHCIVRVHEGRVQFKQPRQRNWRTDYSGPEHYLFMPDEPEKATAPAVAVTKDGPAYLLPGFTLPDEKSGQRRLM